MAATLGVATSCGSQASEKAYNQGINIIPVPLSLEQQDGEYALSAKSSFYASTGEAKTVAEFFATKLKGSTGFDLSLSESKTDGAISLIIDPSAGIKAEGYSLVVTPSEVVITAADASGLFYGMQSFLQLLPAEVASHTLVSGIKWSAPAVTINDAPRYQYRGYMIDACRHFMPVETIKKQLDILAMFKINNFHWHLTEDQGWRIEIKQYPRLTEVGSTRVEGEGHSHSGFYTQEDIKEIVQYAADRFITVIPELELPGHELAAIAAYPELSCRGEAVTPRIQWGVEDIVMCPGKEDMFIFLENVIDEMVTLFPGTYFHIGGDECPKDSWKTCPKCQARIRANGLQASNGHSAEENLQSYVIRRIEKVLEKHGKKLVGWDEILEGGLSPNATVMSWRGEEGGIAAATQGHDVIMTPGGQGMYLDHYQGDAKIEPVAIGGHTTLEKTYSYNPTPDTLSTIGKDGHVIGVQTNIWTEYIHDEDMLEYRMYPRVIALSEIAWSEPSRKDFKDFARRINNAYVRLDAYDVNYHIPQPEQPNGSCNFIAFVEPTTLEFTTTRPSTMVYTMDGSEPNANSTVYTAPIAVSESGVLKICTILPSGKTSPVRTITLEKQSYSPAVEVSDAKPGLKLNMTYGVFFKTSELEAATEWKEVVIDNLRAIRSQEHSSEGMRGVKHYGAVAEGYIDIPEDGVYFISTDNEELWIDDKMIISNEGELKKFSRNDTSIALGKGLHKVKVVFLSHIIAGWPSIWNDGSISMRKSGSDKFVKVEPTQLFY